MDGKFLQEQSAIAKDFVFDLQRFDAVCKIGDTEYESLDTAINAAQAGDTIQLLTDITTTTQINISETLTLDLNGQTIEGTTNVIITVTSGDFTVKDSSSKQEGKISGASYAVGMNGNGVSFTLESGTIETTGDGSGKGAVAISGKNNTFTMRGGTLSAKGNTTADGKNAPLGISMWNTGHTITMTGGTIDATGFGIYPNGTSSGHTIDISQAEGKKTSITSSAFQAIYQAGAAAAVAR